MTANIKPSAQQIRQARADNPKMRERDLAAQMNISEADLVAAYVGDSVRRIEPRVGEILKGLEALGEVMALTRNDSAVHEKIGIYDKVVLGDHASMVLSENIDLRIFPNVWKHGFAVEKRVGDDVRRSLQFFDKAGEAVHKVHLRPASNVEAYEALVESLLSDDQSQTVETQPIEKRTGTEARADARDELRNRWSAMTDVHQFFGMLRELKLDRKDAVGMVGDEYAWPLDTSSVAAMFDQAVEQEVPIMCFVGNHGCIQIHSGPVKTVKPMGPWINIMDPTFHLHLRNDHVSELWAVRKPTKDGIVTSIEAYDTAGELFIQFFGTRHEGEAERDDWRSLVESLPRVSRQYAA